MRLTTIIGFIIGFCVIFFSIFLRGGMEMVGYFVNWPSVLIVFGGTSAAILINFSIRQIVDGLKAFRFTLVTRVLSPESVIEIIVDMAVKARREGFMAIRELSTNGRYPLLDIGVDLVADGTDPEVTRGILETVSDYLHMKISTDERLWRDISVYAPLFGMVGTLVGLILLLRTLSDVETIAPNMSVALMTTFYGIVLAGLFCMPIAGKIRVYNTNMALTREIIIEGIASIQAGDNSQIVREKLKAYLAGRQ
ncbi:MAG TPA: MotA/TolQ/ExbB proton channel family protein [bacterium]|nr:MotA/TolQ/ExbB proton channel family protein [bacterium]HPJ71445.1 MotA/TolQ/ExbB proton channel family protein [bacterium]HPQ66738.1 MotA/TolQ/ExbB proton channel family protein [bacterium]